MKKFLFVLLAAALALPMMAQTKADEAVAKAGYRTADFVVSSTTLQRHQYSGTLNFTREEIPAGYCQVVLAADDVWGDGSGYQMLLDADANTYGSIIPTTGGMTTSGDAPDYYYDEFEYKIPENADGSLYTTNIVLDDAVAIMIPAGTYDWCITNPTPGDRMWIASSNGNIPGRYDDFEFAAGGTYVFYVSYGGQNDQVDLEVVDPNAPVMPENLTADPAATTADLAWENDHDPAFNLRYRVYNPNVAQELFWDFEDYDFEDWMILDNDGDGNNWYYSDGDGWAYSGDVCLVSASYAGGALEPDNWLMSPVVPLGGTVSFMAGPYSSYWPDVFAVYLAVGDGENIDDYVMIGGDYAPTAWTEFSFDLSDYAGETGRIAIRHYNCYNQWRLLVDDFKVVVPGEEPNEWIYVENVEGNEYTLKGLDPETTYEVQVQAVAPDGRTSDWTKSTIFTTLEAGDVELPVAPVITVQTNDLDVVLGATEVEGAVVTFYQCEDQEGNNPVEIDNPTSFVREEENYVVYVYAVATNAAGETSSVVTMVVIPARVTTAINELTNGKTVAGVRYFNMAGQEMTEANGMTIVVTTYTDGTTSAAKVIK